MARGVWKAPSLGAFFFRARRRRFEKMFPFLPPVLHNDFMDAPAALNPPVSISLVIPAFNEEKHIGDCVRQATAAFQAVAAARAVEYEIIVVDNNSTDRTAELAREGGATVVFEPVNQISRARNRGAAEARHDWLLFVDADSLLSPELLFDTIDAMRQDDIGAGGALIRFPSSARFSVKATALLWNQISRFCKLAAGTYIFCRRELFCKMGGFDETVFATEEIWFCRRVKRLLRAEKLRFVILRRFPLQTSDRKDYLYTPWEMLRLLLRLVVAPNRTIRDPASCHVWYDGRR